MLNLRLSSIVGAYEAIADLQDTHGIANHRVLALITAADTTELRKDVLLEGASNLNEWLICEQGEEPIHLVNRWQIMARGSELSAAIRSEVRRLKREMTRSSEINATQLQIACAILLQDEGEIVDLVGQLTEDDRAQLQGWPIWALHEKRE